VPAEFCRIWFVLWKPISLQHQKHWVSPDVKRSTYRNRRWWKCAACYRVWCDHWLRCLKIQSVAYILFGLWACRRVQGYVLINQQPSSRQCPSHSLYPHWFMVMMLQHSVSIYMRLFPQIVVMHPNISADDQWNKGRTWAIHHVAGSGNIEYADLVFVTAAVLDWANIVLEYLLVNLIFQVLLMFYGHLSWCETNVLASTRGLQLAGRFCCWC
jgi:hypothetical protein